LTLEDQTIHQDVDFSSDQSVVKDGKGNETRLIMPTLSITPQQRYWPGGSRGWTREMIEGFGHASPAHFGVNVLRILRCLACLGEDVSATMIDTHAESRGKGVRSPVDLW
jgi:hypothetical protein